MSQETSSNINQTMFDGFIYLAGNSNFTYLQWLAFVKEGFLKWSYECSIFFFFFAEDTVLSSNEKLYGLSVFPLGFASPGTLNMKFDFT